MISMEISHLSYSEKIIKSVENLPFFSLNDLSVFKDNKNYLKISLSRLAKRKIIIPLKKSYYVSRKYVEGIEKKDLFQDYLEFVGQTLYQPSYFSLESVLSEFNILTELTQNFTFVTKNKTKKIPNELGIFTYHHLREELFCGFQIIKKNDFYIYKATKAKALFDFLYLRKNILVTEEAIKELRLNLEDFTKKERKELEGLVKKEGSKKMRDIYYTLF